LIIYLKKKLLPKYNKFNYKRLKKLKEKKITAQMGDDVEKKIPLVPTKFYFKVFSQFPVF